MERKEVDALLESLSLVGHVMRESEWYDNLAYAIVYPKFDGKEGKGRFAVWARKDYQGLWSVSIEVHTTSDFTGIYLGKDLYNQEEYQPVLDNAIKLCGWLAA